VIVGWPAPSRALFELEGKRMSDFAIAGMLLAFLIGLAIAAPIWGVDSRDGIESDQSARRVAWLQGSQHGSAFGQAQAFMTGRSTGFVVAGMLRSAARRIDADAVSGSDLDRQAVLA
jgi:hypothetical protein